MRRIDESVLKKIDEHLNSRYSARLARYGRDPRTLGWDTRANQAARFAVALQSVDFANKKVLDVGCGLADFYTYIRSQDIEVAGYIGLDINGDLVEEAKRQHPNGEFIVGNLLTTDLTSVAPDIVVMFGVMNFRFSEVDNEKFAWNMLSRAYELAGECAVADMLSSVTDPDYTRESFVYYYETEKVLSWGLELSANVQIRCDYIPMSQKELKVIVRREPCG